MAKFMGGLMQAIYSGVFKRSDTGRCPSPGREADLNFVQKRIKNTKFSISMIKIPKCPGMGLSLLPIPNSLFRRGHRSIPHLVRHLDKLPSVRIGFLRCLLASRFAHSTFTKPAYANEVMLSRLILYTICYATMQAWVTM